MIPLPAMLLSPMCFKSSFNPPILNLDRLGHASEDCSILGILESLNVKKFH